MNWLGKNSVRSEMSLFNIQDKEVVWPLKSNLIRRGLINHTFGNVRRDKYGRSKCHQGWDLKARVSTPIYSIANSEVVYIRKAGAYGLQICLFFWFRQQRFYVFYAHLQSVTVDEGESVSIGQHIGFTGKSGNASRLHFQEDEHLHFEIRTRPYCSTGLTGRLSPIRVYGRCPLKSPITQI